MIRIAGTYGIVWVYSVTTYLPLLGFATALLPSDRLIDLCAAAITDAYAATSRPSLYL